MDPRDDRPVGSGDVERYEQLRAHALHGQVSGWRLGLAVVHRQGVAAWLRLGQQIEMPAPARPRDDTPIGADALVGVLTTMALACLGEG